MVNPSAGSGHNCQLSIVNRVKLTLLLLALLLLQQGFFMSPQASAESVAPYIPYVDVTDEVGLADNRVGEDRAVGQAWGDFDNDGWQDLYLTDSAGANTLFRNIDGERFERVTDDAVALADAYSGGAIFADYDNDGWQDLYVLNWGPNVLLRNVEGTYVDVSAESNTAGTDKNSQTASWGDYDQDGFLDLYVANWACYPRCGRPQDGEVDRLYHNNGDGTFEDVTNLLGGGTNGAGFVASFVDFDNDRDLDIYLVNDEFIKPTGNKLWRNDGAGCKGWCFTEISKENGSNSKLMGMGLATADYDRDGDFDFFFSNAGAMELLQNDGGNFTNVAADAGVEFSQGIGWGNVFLDYDNDGWQDLYIATMGGTDGEHPGNPLFRNDGNGGFKPVYDSGARDYGKTLGVATADYDQNGQVDMIIGNIDDGYHLLRNQSDRYGYGGNWVTFKLVGTDDINRDAIGSRIYLTTEDGAQQMGEVIAGSSLGGGSELALHFGLGDEESAEIRLIWPNGVEETLANIPANQRFQLNYGADNQQLFPSQSIFSDVPSSVFIAVITIAILAAIIFIRSLKAAASEKKPAQTD